MRRAAKVDANHAEIVRALRAAGATVQSLAAVGQGVPDILVGYFGENWLFEIKTETGKLTADEAKWHDEWRGDVRVVRTVEAALGIIRLPFE